MPRANDRCLPVDGICVATTIKGRSSTKLCPSTVTYRNPSLRTGGLCLYLAARLISSSIRTILLNMECLLELEDALARIDVGADHVAGHGRGELYPRKAHRGFRLRSLAVRSSPPGTHAFVGYSPSANIPAAITPPSAPAPTMTLRSRRRANVRSPAIVVKIGSLFK